MSDLLYVPDAVAAADADRLQAFLDAVPTSFSSTFDARTFTFRRLQVDGCIVGGRLEACAGRPVWDGAGFVAGPAVPEALATLMRAASRRVVDLGFVPSPGFEGFTSVYVDRYERGGSFSPHVDRDGYGPVVVGFSIGPGSARLTFSSAGCVVEEVEIEPRSMYAFRGELRSGPVEHAVSCVTDLRFGITFRTSA